MEKEYGVYLGICVQNNDPEMRGRIKIFIPQLSPTITGLNKNVDKFFSFLGSETNNTFTKVIEDIKATLPWSEFAGPIMGGNASGRYNASSKKGTTSDSNAWEKDAFGLSVQRDGYRPVQNFVSSNSYNDAFSSTGGHKNQFVNQYSYQYTPSNYSGLARGLFSIPNVGSHVYTFFIDGDRNFPVYFASAYGQEDIKRIFTMSDNVDDNESVDYPKNYENVSKPLLDSDEKTFRSKTVFNTNKNTLELIDTDLKEMIKLTHYSGSFKEFNNYANIEFATNNDQRLVAGDQFLTVNRNRSDYVRANSELIIGGDYYHTIGEATVDQIKEIVGYYKQIHDYKMLFNSMRVKYGENYYTGNQNILSTLQKKMVSPLATYANYYFQEPLKLPLINTEEGKGTGHIRCPTCRGKAYDPYDTEGGKLSTDDMWFPAPEFKKETCVFIGEDPGGAGSAGGVGDVGGEIAVLFTETMSIYAPINPLGEPHPLFGQYGIYKGAKCSTCNGEGTILSPSGSVKEGYSPSSENGMFMPDLNKIPGSRLDQKIAQLSPKIFEAENNLGQGGDEIVNISMSKIETIGLVMNDMKSYRIDPIGKLKIDGCTVAPQATYESFRPSPHVEYVDVDDIPGGDYILTAMNKYKLLVGAKGINIETYGPIDIYGAIVNFNGEQINISSKNEILIDGGERLSLRGRKIALLPVEQNAVVVEGQLHVTRNSIFEGGMMIEGEIGLLHITAPLEWQKTEIGIYNVLDGECTIPAKYDGSQITMPMHTHYFKNIPLTLEANPETVRETLATRGINSRDNIVAASRASNETACSENVTAAVQKLWEKKYAVPALKKSVDKAGKTSEWNDECYRFVGATCQSAQVDAEGNRSQKTTLMWRWRLGNKQGYVRVSGVVSEFGIPAGEPTVS